MANPKSYDLAEEKRIVKVLAKKNALLCPCGDKRQPRVSGPVRAARNSVDGIVAGVTADALIQLICHGCGHVRHFDPGPPGLAP